MDKSLTQGIHHFGLTVSKLKESANFFTSLLGWKIVKVKEEYPAIFVSDGTVMITLWAIKNQPVVEFDRKQNVGLHHLALAVDNQNELDKIYNILKDNKVNIEFKPENLGNGPAVHMMCIEPSGNRIEFIWPGK